jgi:hypothetical protein
MRRVRSGRTFRQPGTNTQRSRFADMRETLSHHSAPRVQSRVSRINEQHPDVRPERTPVEPIQAAKANDISPSSVSALDDEKLTLPDTHLSVRQIQRLIVSGLIILAAIQGQVLFALGSEKNPLLLDVGQAQYSAPVKQQPSTNTARP